MQKETKNILSLSILLLGMVFLAGCGTKKAPVKEPMQKQTEKASKSNPKIETPVATGKVDATIDAIIGGADSEKLQATSDEADVKALTDDSTDSNNLSKTYEQEL
ncbi:MAG: hypothetical protein WAV73_02285 [Candidatus Moraniibacteriota bacterium]